MTAFSLFESDLSKLSHACDLLKEALANNPTSSELHAALATCYLIHGNRDQGAYEELKIAIELNPHDGKLYSTLATVITTRSEIAAHEGEALELLKKAITLNPEYWNYYKSLGLEYWKKGRHMDAKFSFEMAQEKMTSGKSGIEENIFNEEQQQLHKWIKAIEQNQTYRDGNTT